MHATSRCDDDQPLREHVLGLLRGGGAHLPFDEAVTELPADLRGVKPRDLPHTPWRLVEHMRIAQRDILDFSRDADYASPPWPQGFWPDGNGPPDDAAWEDSLRQFRADHQAMQDLVRDPATDLVAPIPWGDGQTVLREAMLVADHNAYHLGQLVTVRRLLGAWSD